MLPSVDEVVANFELLDDWEERYRYLIELGRMLPTLPPEAHSDANKVQGCIIAPVLILGFWDAAVWGGSGGGGLGVGPPGGGGGGRAKGRGSAGAGRGGN